MVKRFSSQYDKISSWTLREIFFSRDKNIFFAVCCVIDDPPAASRPCIKFDNIARVIPRMSIGPCSKNRLSSIATIACHTWGGNVSTDTGAPIIRFDARISLPSASMKITAAGRVSCSIASSDGICKNIITTYIATATIANINKSIHHTKTRTQRDGCLGCLRCKSVFCFCRVMFVFMMYIWNYITNNLRFSTV